jgi:hypothetical protein
MAQAAGPDSGDASRGATASLPWQFLYLTGLEREPSSTVPAALASITKSSESDRINKSESPARESEPNIHTHTYVLIHKSNDDVFSGAHSSSFPISIRSPGQSFQNAPSLAHGRPNEALLGPQTILPKSRTVPYPARSFTSITSKHPRACQSNEAQG